MEVPCGGEAESTWGDGVSGKKCERRREFSFCRKNVGTWPAAGTEEGLDYNSGMQGVLDINPRREKYRIVTVHQPPFMYYNEDTSMVVSFIATHIYFC